MISRINKLPPLCFHLTHTSLLSIDYKPQRCPYNRGPDKRGSTVHYKLLLTTSCVAVPPSYTPLLLRGSLLLSIPTICSDDELVGVRCGVSVDWCRNGHLIVVSVMVEECGVAGTGLTYET